MPEGTLLALHEEGNVRRRDPRRRRRQRRRARGVRGGRSRPEGARGHGSRTRAPTSSSRAGTRCSSGSRRRARRWRRADPSRSGSSPVPGYEPGFAFGTMRLTGDGLWGPPADSRVAIRLLQTAAESGVTWFDTADAYGPGISDRLLAEALDPDRRDDVRVMVKVGLERPHRDRWIPRGTPEALRAAVGRSLKRLRVESADALLLHTVDPDVPVQESIGALAELAEAGLARQIGICNVDDRTLALARGVAPIAFVQNPLNAIDTEHLDLAASCAAAGIGFIAWWPLRGGELARDPTLAAVARSLRPDGCAARTRLVSSRRPRRGARRRIHTKGRARRGACLAAHGNRKRAGRGARRTREVIALAWSGGKDSAIALERLRGEGRPPGLLMTTVDEDSGRATHHGIPSALLRAQATGGKASRSSRSGCRSTPAPRSMRAGCARPSRHHRSPPRRRLPSGTSTWRIFALTGRRASLRPGGRRCFPSGGPTRPLWLRRWRAITRRSWSQSIPHMLGADVARTAS